jgi:hypothetical protein
MRILIVLAALFTLTGCESFDFVAVDYHSGHNYGPYVRPVNHISYTLGYYSGSYYNGYQVYGTHGHRYYHAPRYYSGHRHFSRPVVVQHVHVHTTYCEHNYRPRNHYTPPVVVRNDRRHTPPRSTPPRHTPPRRTPPRAVPPQVRNDRRNDRGADRSYRREDRQDRRKNKERKRK